ncbi:hypothetical protein LSAT2_010151 [Lamellibrachia satsuma]|nr:hypothetical protein LSAT2_010151 [Lamellibrachia satsuma]
MGTGHVESRKTLITVLKAKRHAQRQREYRERKRIKEGEEWLRRERERKRKYYRPSGSTCTRGRGARRAARGSWPSSYTYDDLTQPAFPPTTALTPGTNRASRRGNRSSANKLHSCTFPGCDKTFCHATHARRHERNSHHFWRSGLRHQQPTHNPGCRASVSADPDVVASGIGLDFEVYGVNSVAVDAGEWNQTADTKQPADSLITGSSANTANTANTDTDVDQTESTDTSHNNHE